MSAEQERDELRARVQGVLGVLKVRAEGLRRRAPFDAIDVAAVEAATKATESAVELLEAALGDSK